MIEKELISKEGGKRGPRRKPHRIKLSKYAPIFKWLPKYSQYQAVSDAIAGITIGLTMIPQSIAYAGLAGLSPQYGLYSSFLGGFLYTVLGSVKEISIGPTSLMALLTIEFTKGTNPDFVILLTFLAGCIEFLMGSLNLGFLVDFISLPVTSGFTSATAVIIIVSQLKGLLGLKFQAENLVDQLSKIHENYRNIRFADCSLGFISIAVLLIFRKLKDIKTSNPGAAKMLWFLSVGRNALVVLVCSVISFYLHQAGHTPFVLSGKVRSGMPDLAFPKFSTTHQNQTYGFFDMCRHMGSGIVILPLVSVLANVAIAKVFASGAGVNASQEMRTLGLCNLLGSCVSSMPTAGAFTRSAVSHASGIQTPMAGIYSGLMTVFALSFLTPYFYFIPKPVLSAVLISAVVFLFDWQIVQRLWTGSKRDALATVGTFIVCILYNVEAGLLFGISFNIMYLLFMSARPKIRVTECTGNLEQKYVLVQPGVGLFYPAVDFVADRISDVADEYENIPVIVDCQRFRGVDYTAVKGLEKLAQDFKKRNHRLCFVNLSNKVLKLIERLGDSKDMQILKNEAEIMTAFLSLDNSIKVQIASEDECTDIPMEKMKAIEPLEHESFIAKKK